MPYVLQQLHVVCDPPRGKCSVRICSLLLTLCPCFAFDNGEAPPWGETHTGPGMDVSKLEVAHINCTGWYLLYFSQLVIKGVFWSFPAVYSWHSTIHKLTSTSTYSGSHIPYTHIIHTPEEFQHEDPRLGPLQGPLHP